MADVYEAEDRLLQRQVAVKLFRAAAASDRARFDAEIVVLAALNHPGLVQVYDAGDQDGDAYVVLELIEGPTLAARLERGGPVPPIEVADLGIQVADALAYVHERGVVHRDVTPSNVLCGSDGRPRLADFGIARLVDTTRITAAATAVGTAAYMAPEQVQGLDVTPAADVYSLGLVLLEMLTGRRAFTGGPQEVAVARLARDPDIGTGVPGAWRDLLRAMTQRAASDRPSAAAVRDRLAGVLDGAEVRTGALAAVPPVVVAAPLGDAGGAGAATAVTPVSGGTTVMPAALAPGAEPTAAGRQRAIVAVVVGGLLLALALVVGRGAGSGIDAPTPPTTAVTEPVVAEPTPTTTTVPPTTTTAAPRGAEPPGAGRGDEKGPRDGKGGGKKDD